jgi:LEA14-like dessication related protein
VADLKLLNVGVFEQKYRVALRVQNPNRFDLGLEGLDYELLVNSELLATGVSRKPVTIPGYGVEIVEVEGFGNVGEVLLSLLDLRKGIPDKVPYRLKGHVRIAQSPARLPFDYSGEISLRGEGKRSGGP